MIHPLLFYLCLFGGLIELCVVGEDEFEDDRNQCDMTYMWRHMHFMDVGFVSESSRYSLFLYGEGLYAANFLKNGKLTGLPIIFVPGTAGSGRQVRSIGSMLQNKTDLRKTTFHFDTFAVDFSEELTAISSEYLVMQSKYLTSAIEHVWSLYAKKPPGIVLVGHSVGGIVIQKSVLLHPNFDKSKISMVISLATPYNEPAYLFDKTILQLWLTLDEKSEQYAKSEPPHIPFVSISGGLKDEFIEEEWTDSKYHLHASTSSIDRVNLDMDHKCIMWCNQLIRQISRVLLDYAEKPNCFLKDPAENLRVYYKGAGSTLQPFVPADTHVFGPEDCVPQCPSSGILSFTTNSTIIGHHFLLVLSNDTQTHLVDLVCPDAALHCPAVGLSRFLSSSVLYSFLNLANLTDGSAVKVKLEATKTWLLSKPDVVMPKKSLSFTEIASEVLYGGPITSRISVSDGLKILPIEFVHVGVASSIIYKMTVQAIGCKTEGIRRVIFFQGDLLSRMSEVDRSGNPISITIYESKKSGKEAMIVFINEFGCKYDIHFQIDYGYTIIKAIRRYRHIIPLSVILTTTALYIVASTQTYSFNYTHYVVLSSIFSFCMGRFCELVSVILLTDCAFMSGFYLLVRLLVLPVLNFLNSVKWLSLRAFWKVVVLTVITSFSLFTHSLFIAFACSFSNLLIMVSGRISNFWSLFAMITLQLIVVFMQIPSFIVYFWNLKAYGQFYAHDDPFLEANTLVLLFCVSETGLSLLREPLPSKYCHLLNTFRYIFANILQLSCFLCIFLVFYRNGIYSYQVLDDLCIVCAAILGILWRPGAVIYNSSNNNKE